MNPSGLSFVICAAGRRQSFLDEIALPSIAEQAPDPFEVVIAGRYDGRHGRERWVRRIEAPVGDELFHFPFQSGASAAEHEWVVLLGDDMFLASGWMDGVRAAPEPEAGVLSILGCTMLNPDGSVFGGCFDAIDNARSGPMRGASTYFSAFLAPAELYRRVPYPTYSSCDRVHVLRIARAGVPVRKLLLDGARVVHAGASASHPGLTPRTSVEQVERYGRLLTRCRERGVAWEAFADRHLDGRPDVTEADALRLVDAAAGDPAMRRTADWLQADPPAVTDAG